MNPYRDLSVGAQVESLEYDVTRGRIIIARAVGMLEMLRPSIPNSALAHVDDFIKLARLELEAALERAT